MYSESHVLVDTKTVKINRMYHLISLFIAMDMDLIHISFYPWKNPVGHRP